MTTDELLASLFEEPSHLLCAPMREWLRSSRRFDAFVADARSKIRKKLRAARGAESLRDLRLELETAYLLLREKSLGLEYEPQGGQARGPDFAVRFTTSFVFMLEVTRLREGRPKPPTAGTALPAEERFAGKLCSKLGQLLPQHGNLLLVGVEAPELAPADLPAAMLRIQQRAEGGDPSVVERPGFRDRADFFRHYRRLSAVLVRGTSLQAGAPVLLWDNPQAKTPLPGKVRTALARSHTL